MTIRSRTKSMTMIVTLLLCLSQKERNLSSCGGPHNEPPQYRKSDMCNRQFRSSLQPLFQIKSMCKVFVIKLMSVFDHNEIRTNYQDKKFYIWICFEERLRGTLNCFCFVQPNFTIKVVSDSFSSVVFFWSLVKLSLNLTLGTLTFIL